MLDELYNAGADPGVVMQDLLDLTHWLTRLKLVPDAGQPTLTPEAERVRGKAMADKLTMPILARAWQMLLKGLQETQSAPSPIRAAEMALVRLAYASDLPSPADAIRSLQGAAAAQPAAPSGPGGSRVAAPAAAPSSNVNARSTTRATGSPAGASSGAPVAQLAVQEQREEVASAPPKPMPGNFEAVVALLEERREIRLASQLINNVHVVRCEAGRLEFRPAQDAPPDLASKLGEMLARLTGQRWMISVSSEPGQETLASQRRALEASTRQAAASHPLVRKALEVFPGAVIERVRSTVDAPLPIAGPDAALADLSFDDSPGEFDEPLADGDL
jgi:DNA polymerase-3 subunit gamma/tau